MPIETTVENLSPQECWGAKLTVREEGNVLGTAEVHVFVDQRSMTLRGRVQKVRIAKEDARKGYGDKVAMAAEEFLVQQGCEAIYARCGARKLEIAPLYEARGYVRHAVELKKRIERAD